VKLFERLRSLGIGAAGTVRTTRTKREEMGDETMDIQETVEENTQGRTTGKRKVPAERFSTLLTDLKLVHDTQIPWGQLYAELSKSC
jgi:hypothetical protein